MVRERFAMRAACIMPNLSGNGSWKRDPCARNQTTGTEQCTQGGSAAELRLSLNEHTL